MAVADAKLLFLSYFQLTCQDIKGKNYGFRFVGPPYTTKSPKIVVYTDDRNPQHLNAESILAILHRLKLTQAAFKDAYNEFYGGEQKRA
jgi:hypothetical protein